ncbi:STAS domain-containing protein [Kitasatospora sp. NPDC089913]|uniref:STAS domain-containing protein n=1 Tax=Streptomycetaceae TaxID=2062 RepID=UPI0008795FEE|nr:STAS domain-containing protein [Streptomyces sp. TLI_053]SDT83058.1 anti-sigma B factor antagonist [Streptomyces sp. TLI_053]
MPTQNDPAAAQGAAATATGTTARPQPVDDRTAVCVLVGDLDIETLPPAEQALDEALRTGPRILVVDLGQVGFCDSSGLNLLLKARMSATAAGAELRLAAASPTVLRLLELTGADTVFQLHPTVGDALAVPR